MSSPVATARTAIEVIWPAAISDVITGFVDRLSQMTRIGRPVKG